MRLPTRLLLTLLFFPLLAACSSYAWRSGALIDSPNTAPEIALTNQDGNPFRLSNQQGVVTLLFFGYTNCPDVCPTTLADLAAARKRLGADANRVRVVFITVDPTRDTPDRLRSYMRSFDPDFVALTGSDSDLQAVYRSYSIVPIKRDLPDGQGYAMDHTSSVYVIDLAGRWRALISTGAAIDDTVADLRYLMKQS